MFTIESSGVQLIQKLVSYFDTIMTCVFLAAYKDLQSREDTRNGAWQQEGWDEVVYYTGTEDFSSLF